MDRAAFDIYVETQLAPTLLPIRESSPRPVNVQVWVCGNMRIEGLMRFFSAVCRVTVAYLSGTCRVLSSVRRHGVASLAALRAEVETRLPQVDLPELILEMQARTGFADHFTHASEGGARAADTVRAERPSHGLGQDASWSIRNDPASQDCARAR